MHIGNSKIFETSQGISDASGIAYEGEKFRLMIWDLDETIRRVAAMREITSAAANRLSFVRVLDIESCVHDDSEVLDHLDFDRRIYFRVFQTIETALRTEGSAWPLKALDA